MKHFIAVGPTSELLHVGRPQLQNLFPYFPHVYVTKRQTRLFVSAYIDAYAQTLSPDESATVGTAQAFVRTEAAKQLIQSAQADFEREIDSKIAFSANEVAALFCVSRMTITGWYQGGVLEPFVHTVYPKRDRGKGKRRFVSFSRIQVQQAYEWRLPLV